MKQKDIFLKDEGDAWFHRNEAALKKRHLPEDDPILMELLRLMPAIPRERMKVLEIGCGNGIRLNWLKENMNADCYGIDPSANAVAAACAKGVKVQQGTADDLPFDSQSFDIVIFGFCLYLCDREDLFSIAREADRVLRLPGWLMILDFFNPSLLAKDYRHHPNVQSYKMDYRTLFDWHPDYICVVHKICNHATTFYDDEPDEWVATSVLRKFKVRPEV